MPFGSILYEVDLPPRLPDHVPAPDFFVNLNLDQVVAAIVAVAMNTVLNPFPHAGA